MAFLKTVSHVIPFWDVDVTFYCRCHIRSFTAHLVFQAETSAARDVWNMGKFLPFPYNESQLSDKLQTEHRNAEGRTYWFNTSTKESVWEKPEGTSVVYLPPIFTESLILDL